MLIKFFFLHTKKKSNVKIIIFLTLILTLCLKRPVLRVVSFKASP